MIKLCYVFNEDKKNTNISFVNSKFNSDCRFQSVNSGEFSLFLFHSFSFRFFCRFHSIPIDDFVRSNFVLILIIFAFRCFFDRKFALKNMPGESRIYKTNKRSLKSSVFY